MLTKRMALEQTMELWCRLAEYPDLSKFEIAEDMGIGDYLHCCPCCEFTNLNHLHNCDKCPIWGKYYRVYPESSAVCEEYGMPYDNWLTSRITLKSKSIQSKYALDIVYLAEAALDALEDEGGYDG
jgi:hypothetical protein